MIKFENTDVYYNPIIKHLKSIGQDKELNLLEIGPGKKLLKSIVPKNVVYHSLDYAGDHTYLADLDKGRLEIEDNSYDIVVCLEVLEHTMYPKKVIKEIKRIAKKDAVIFISMPNEYNLYLRLLYLFGIKNWLEKDDPFSVVENHLHIQTPRVKDILKLFGDNFKIEKKYYFWYSNLAKHKPYLRFIDYICQLFSNIYPSLFTRNVEVKAINN